MILGDICTRNCAFCAISHDKPLPVDSQEPERVAQTVQQLGLQYAVVTSVTRDDLADGGAGHFAATIRAIRKLNPTCKIEVLIPDFGGCAKSLEQVLNEKPHVINHNIETVAELYPIVRPQARYEQSLELLRRAAEKGATTKSGFMLGCGETNEEVIRTMKDLRQAGCQLLTIGQYLPPSRRHLSVKRFVPPAEFEWLKDLGLQMGFQHVESGPLVRSSYHAQQQAERCTAEPLLFRKNQIKV